ncbi:MAG: methionyl-tRNA formyltransferase [Chitinophagales bacterium]
MRILYLANNWVGWKAAEVIKESGAEIVGVVVHPENKQKYVNEILDELSLPADRVFPASSLHDPEVIKTIVSLKPDIGISVFFGYIIKPEVIRIFPKGLINLHPSLLPYNRGANPNVWSIVEGTPAGATLHYIDEGIDTGDIIQQIQVEVEPIDTGETLYHKLESACIELFRQTWTRIKVGETTKKEQGEKGTMHRLSDLDMIDCIDLEQSVKAADLINILRARTFPPYKGAYFIKDGKKVYLKLQLEYED